jgi:putative endonuclease
VPSRESKRLAHLSGKAAEAVVARDLESRGLVILDTNVRLGHLELDIVARDQDTVVVVEVRTRGATAWQTGMESIARIKAKRVRTAGERLWRKRFERDPSVNRMRFDVAVVTYDPAGAPSIEYARGVF